MSEQAKNQEDNKLPNTTTKTEVFSEKQKLTKLHKKKYILPKYRLDFIDHAIIKERMQNPSMTILEIAQKLDIDRVRIGKRLASEPVREFLKDQAKHTSKILQESTNKAARVLRELLNDKDSRVRLQAAKIILEGLGELKQYSETEAKITVDSALNKIGEYALRYNMSIEDYCKKEGIDLVMVKNMGTN